MSGSQAKLPRRAVGNRRPREPRKSIHTRNRDIDPVTTHDRAFKAVVEAVERAGVTADIDSNIRNPKREGAKLNAKAWLTAAIAEVRATGKYDRSLVWARIKGLTPAQQMRLKLPGLRTQSVSYDVCYKQALRVERALQQGWKVGGASDRGWDWFTERVLAASRMTRDADGSLVDPAAAATAVAIDDTSQSSWGHRTGPNPTKEQQAAGVTSCGTDRDARNGRRTPTDAQPGEHFYGYQVTVVVMVPEVHWSGDPYRLKVRDYQPPYIIDIKVRPADENPGPHGYEAIVRSRAIAAIDDVVADMGFTMKSESFVRRLHALGINVVMDLPPNDRERVDTHMVGRRRHPVFENSGTFFDLSIPPELEVPPQGLSDADLRDWHARRLLYAYATHQHLGGGDIQLRSPFAAGRLTTDEPVAKATGALHITKPDHAPDAQQAHVTVGVERRDRHQREPHGTWAWWLSYLRRLTVETANARLKKGAGLSNKGCKAMGLGAHTMAAVLLAASYNLDITQRVADEARRDGIATEEQPSDSIASNEEAIALQTHYGGPASGAAERAPPPT